MSYLARALVHVLRNDERACLHERDCPKHFLRHSQLPSQLKRVRVCVKGGKGVNCVYLWVCVWVGVKRGREGVNSVCQKRMLKDITIGRVKGVKSGVSRMYLESLSQEYVIS